MKASPPPTVSLIASTVGSETITHESFADNIPDRTYRNMRHSAVLPSSSGDQLRVVRIEIRLNGGPRD